MAEGSAHGALSSSSASPQSANSQRQPSSSSPSAPPAAQNPLSRKLNKILENSLDNDKETLEALEVLSGFLAKNTLQARRNLRSDLEQRSLALNESFLRCIAQLVDHVRGLQEEAGTMKACCDDMQSRLAAAKTRTAGLLRETAELQARSRLLEMKSKVVASFLSKFELTPEELETITRRLRQGGYVQGGAIDERFFEAVGRVKQIHEDCKALLRTSQQRAGLEIMEAMAMHLETAYEQLYHWAQSQCRLMVGELPETSATLRRALGELRQRPVLFQYCVDEYGIARRMALVQAFIDALTREGSAGRPIELHSHDPVRYCSDMLGWLHQAIASEKDYVSSLVADFDEERTVSILSMVTEGACRPLHIRIEQVVVSTVDPVVGYKLVNLLRYYLGVFTGLLNRTAPLVQTVTDLADLQSKMFFSALNIQTAKILEGIEPPLPDLVPTPKAGELLSLLQQILASRDMTAVLTSESQEQDLRLVLSTCIDPMVQSCSDSVAALGRSERAVYMLNCLYLAQSTVSLYEFTERQLELLEGQIGAHVDALVGEQTNHFLGTAGLLECSSALSHGVGVDEEHFKLVASCREQLASLLSSPEQHLLAQSQLLSSARLRDEIQKRALGQFAEAYRAVYAAVVTKKGGEFASSLLSYTPDSVRQLLD